MEELIIQQSGLMGVPTEDPMVAIAAILLITAARKASAKYPLIEQFIRTYAPLLAVMASVFAHGMISVISGHPPEVTADYVSIIGHGISSGAMAVLGHSATREFAKRVQTEKVIEEEEVVPPK